jgi:hypothetical protein
MLNYQAQAGAPSCETTQVVMSARGDSLVVNHSNVCSALGFNDVDQTAQSSFTFTVDPLSVTRVEDLQTNSSTATTVAAVSSGWGGWGYFAVPQLGLEPVRGTGCGATGSLPETIPDGVWNVIVGDGSGSDVFWSQTQMQVDVRCVYYGAEGQRRLDELCAASPGSYSCTEGNPSWFVVNSNPRLRLMPVASDVAYYNGSSGGSLEAMAPTDPTAFWRWMDCWIVVQGGVVTTVVGDPPHD